MDPWIQTYTGRRFFFLNPKPEDIDIIDIAHALSNQCRYAGHTQTFYSVAEHSYWVSKRVTPENARVALMHDAAEAYLPDVPGPIKQCLGDSWHGIERRIWAAIAEAFGLNPVIPDGVHDIDTRILLDEREHLMKKPPAPWHCDGLEPVGVKPMCWTPSEARDEFIRRFLELRS